MFSCHFFLFLFFSLCFSPLSHIHVHHFLLLSLFLLASLLPLPSPFSLLVYSFPSLLPSYPSLPPSLSLTSPYTLPRAFHCTHFSPSSTRHSPSPSLPFSPPSTPHQRDVTENTERLSPKMLFWSRDVSEEWVTACSLFLSLFIVLTWLVTWLAVFCARLICRVFFVLFLEIFIHFFLFYDTMAVAYFCFCFFPFLMPFFYFFPLSCFFPPLQSPPPPQDKRVIGIVERTYINTTWH